MNVTAICGGGGGGVPSNETEMFLRQSIKMIDDALGDGYARRNPALITSLLLARCREEWEVGQ